MRLIYTNLDFPLPTKYLVSVAPAIVDTGARAQPKAAYLQPLEYVVEAPAQPDNSPGGRSIP